ncbi:UNVERIFIED_CONTAM: hypothetical protein H355_004805 [Colinus virginianus]|nr:hypothetical protein H355_004805 [Colinus virginianus]
MFMKSGRVFQDVYGVNLSSTKKYVAGLIIKTSSDPTCVEVSESFQGRKREVNTAHNLTCLFHSPEREGVSWEAERDSCSYSETGMAKALASFYKRYCRSKQD